MFFDLVLGLSYSQTAKTGKARVKCNDVHGRKEVRNVSSGEWAKTEWDKTYGHYLHGQWMGLTERAAIDSDLRFTSKKSLVKRRSAVQIYEIATDSHFVLNQPGRCSKLRITSRFLSFESLMTEVYFFPVWKHFSHAERNYQTIFS